MKSDGTMILAVGTGIGLGVPFLAAMLAWLSNPALLPSSPLEDVVLTFIVVRSLVYLGVPFVRRLDAGKSAIFLMFDILLFPLSSVAVLLTGESAFGQFGGAFLAVWLSSAILVYPAMGAVLIARSVKRRVRLSYVLPSAVATFGISSLVLDALGGGAGTGGLAAVVQGTLGGLRKPTMPVPWATDLTTGCGAILFAALAVYSITSSRRTDSRLTAQLSIFVLGAVVLFAWLFASAPQAGWEVLGVPTAVIAGLVWVSTRES